ncbi:hypothetical protein A2U01_0016418 [Trifolium medium]|uniref:Uncharacterized protein n=1 Tax=Trifolium medium TaxID=97028 RepID=A0A392N774_9FABA|nr:hypothetical protein [Trifolium medium]
MNLGPILVGKTVKGLIDKYGKGVKNGSYPSLTKGVILRQKNSGGLVIVQNGGTEILRQKNGGGLVVVQNGGAEILRQKNGGGPVVVQNVGAEEQNVGAEEEGGVAGIATALEVLIDCLAETALCFLY